ncbi:MAG: hypothetical protein LBQ33_03170 [Oscillospiraceae bacterium]|nr:hypothetical protein [Oscillospiraceae bacterium]
MKISLKWALFYVLTFVLLFTTACTSQKEKAEAEASSRAAASSAAAQAEKEASQALLDKYTVNAAVGLEELQLQPQEQDSFLYENPCFYFLRSQSPSAYGAQQNRYLSRIFARFGSTPLRKMANYLYAVYETDAKTRVFLFFPKSGAFTLLTGRVILMCDALSYEEFRGIAKGNTMDDVVAVDRAARLYARGYDKTEVSWILGGNAEGSNIVTVHLLTDGVLRIEYVLDETAALRKYVISKMQYAADFNLTDGGVTNCYRILQKDYVTE